MKKHKLIGVEGLRESMSESLKGMIGTPITRGTVSSIKEVSERTLQGLVDAGAVSSFDVGKVQTKHRSKKLLGRLKDFFLWKTPLRRWHFKPFYVQVELSEKFLVLREHTNVFGDMSDEDFEELLRNVRTINVWEERYPEDPYSIVLANVSIQSVLPASHINFAITLERENCESQMEEVGRETGQGGAV